MHRTAKPLRIIYISLMTLLLSTAALVAQVVPPVKQITNGQALLNLQQVSILSASPELKNEIALLRDLFAERNMPLDDRGVPVRLELGEIELPEIAGSYAQDIRDQAYRLTIDNDGIRIRGSTPAGVYYGIRTLSQLIGDRRQIQTTDILDWPDLALRMIMIDLARQIERPDYYKRVIAFCGRYKINGVHLHLTDDQFAALYHEDYPFVMSPKALRSSQIRELVALVAQHHIVLVPEIESFGHNGMFERHPMMRDILHQAPLDSSFVQSYNPVRYDNFAPGFTNVLCPASDLTYEYLDKMYQRAAEEFDFPIIHAGLDEVVTTRCDRCQTKWPGINKTDWFLKHIDKCHEALTSKSRTLGMWNDMPRRETGMSETEILDRLKGKDIVMFDWHYDEVPLEHAKRARERGFEVVGCPSLICGGRLVLPDAARFENISDFAAMARKQDLRGLDVTVWCSQRYMSDALWPGLAFSAAQCWGGSDFETSRFAAGFCRDFFGSDAGSTFAAAWTKLADMGWTSDDIFVAGWLGPRGTSGDGAYRDDWFTIERFLASREVAEQRADEIRDKLASLREVQLKLVEIRPTVIRHEVEWRAFERSVHILAWSMEHLLESLTVHKDGQWDLARVAELDAECMQIIAWIEEDWDRNRFADDLGKDGISLGLYEHLLYWHKMIHRMHQHILKENLPAK